MKKKNEKNRSSNKNRRQVERAVHKTAYPSRFIPRADRKLKKVFGEIGVPEQVPFVPDDFQVRAAKAIADSDVLVSAPTGSGKTWIALQAMRDVLAQGKRAWYATPLKALSNSKFIEFATEFGFENAGILTGDRKENMDAPIIVGTTEILRNQLYDTINTGEDFGADLVVLDEAHYLGDRDRGVVWEEVMIYLPPRVRLLMLSATIRNDDEIASWLTHIRKKRCRVVHSEKRHVPLYPLYLLPGGEMVFLSGKNGISRELESFLKRNESKRSRGYGSAIQYEHILKALETFNLLPAVFFLKSRFECNSALYACRRRYVSGRRSNVIKEQFQEIIKDFPFLEQHPQKRFALEHGLGSHHSGQLPHWKMVIEKLMNGGYLDAIFSTSTVAAGVNFPARTVVLAQSDRFNGKEFVDLTATEFHQAAGRAGRRGKDKVGFVVVTHGPFQDPHLLDHLIDAPPDPIESQIGINFSMCLNLLLSLTPEDIHHLLNQSYAAFKNADLLKRLDGQNAILSEKAKNKLAGGRCENIQQALQRINKRKEAQGSITRLKKKRKRYLKGCYKAGVSTEKDELLDEINGKIAALSETLNKMPCNACTHVDLCRLKKRNHFTKIIERAQETADALEEARDVLWKDFCKHLDFMQMNGFADKQCRLTEDGIWASKLRLDQPLIIAELIRQGVVDTMTPELMAGTIAVFVSDKYRDISLDPEVNWDKKPLVSAFYKTRDAIEPMVNMKKKHGFPVPQIQFWPAAVLYAWACGLGWDDVLQLTSVDEGDLAMLIFRTADNLRQIASLDKTHPETADKARTSMKMLLREPVVIPT